MKKELFLEIGAEELPAREVVPAVEALKSGLVAGLAALRLSHGEPRVFATPRRLAVVVPDVSARQPDLVEELEGPRVEVAFKDGAPTKAAEGFAKKVGLPVEKLGRKQTPKGEVIAATLERPGQDAQALLPELLASLPSKIPFTRVMRWGSGDAAFARPVQWMVALFGGEVIRFSFGDVASGRQSRGHRFLAPAEFAVEGAEQWARELEKRSVIPSVEARRAKIVALAAEAARSLGGTLRPDDDLVDEVTQLVEWPVPLLGRFDASFLEIPDEVLISEMREHQRYFSVLDARGRLMPGFVVIANTRVEDPEVSVAGYRRVLSARFQDGKFFFVEDQKIALWDRVKKLETMAFHRALGTTYEKVERVVALAFWIGKELGFDVGEGSPRALAEGPPQDTMAWRLARAGYLMKADLGTQMVFEFPELQGVMGRAYAERSGEPPEVSKAIEEHYLPRNAGDRLPAGDLGALLGLADRLDTIAGIFSTGKGPTGAADPFGLRRAALGVLNVLKARGWRLSLSRAIDRAVQGIGAKAKKDGGEIRAEIADFVRARLKGLLVAGGAPQDVAEAVLVASADDALVAHARAEALAALVARPEIEPVKIAFKRVANILRDQPKGAAVARAALAHDSERQLFDAIARAEGAVADATKAGRYADAFTAIAAIRPELDRFFEAVMVLDPDPAVRGPRVALLGRVEALFAPLADFRALS